VRVKFWRCEITRWMADEPFPGIVEARARDTNGQDWVFIDKSAIFSAEALTGATKYPVDGVIGCNVVREASGVSRVTTIWTGGFRPEGVPFDELKPGSDYKFDVLTADLSDADGVGGAAT
jgi:hypothetical protein